MFSLPYIQWGICWASKRNTSRLMAQNTILETQFLQWASIYVSESAYCFILCRHGWGNRHTRRLPTHSVCWMRYRDTLMSSRQTEPAWMNDRQPGQLIAIDSAMCAASHIKPLSPFAYLWSHRRHSGSRELHSNTPQTCPETWQELQRIRTQPAKFALLFLRGGIQSADIAPASACRVDLTEC